MIYKTVKLRDIWGINCKKSDGNLDVTVDIKSIREQQLEDDNNPNDIDYCEDFCSHKDAEDVVSVAIVSVMSDEEKVLDCCFTLLDEQMCYEESYDPCLVAEDINDDFAESVSALYYPDNAERFSYDLSVCEGMKTYIAQYSSHTLDEENRYLLNIIVSHIGTILALAGLDLRVLISIDDNSIEGDKLEYPESDESIYVRIYTE